MNLLKKHFLFYHIFQCIPSSNKCNPYDICNKRCSIITKEYYHLSTIVSKNVSINTLTNVTKEIQYCFVLIVEVGGGAVIKCFRGKIVGNFAQILQNDPLLQLGTEEI